MAVAAQGLTERRPTGRVDRRHLRKVFGRIGVIQIDSVNVLVRSQELPLFARLGPHPRTMLADALDDGELFEYWAHMAAIAPSSQHRLFRWRMDQAHQWDRVDGLRHRRPKFLDEVLDRVRELGPITAADLGERVGKKGSVVGLGRRQDRPRAPLPPRARRRPPAAQRLRPALRPPRAAAAGGGAGGAGADRGRGAQGAARRSPPGRSVSPRSATSPTTTARGTWRASRSSPSSSTTACCTRRTSTAGASPPTYTATPRCRAG